MGTTITDADLAERLADVLERVRSGERFVVERDGEPVAAIAPATVQPTITVGEFLALLDELPRPDPSFADDLAEAHASQGVVEYSDWPD